MHEVSAAAEGPPFLIPHQQLPCLALQHACIERDILHAGSKTWQAMVVMTKGRSYQQQSYKVAAQFPCEWVRRKASDGFMITCCGTIGSRDNYYWVVVVTAGTGYDSQAVELDFVYPSEAIHHYWDRGELGRSMHLPELLLLLLLVAACSWVVFQQQMLVLFYCQESAYVLHWNVELAVGICPSLQIRAAFVP